MASIRTYRRLTGVLLLVGAGYCIWLLANMDRRPALRVGEAELAPGDAPAKPEEETGCWDDLVMDFAGDRLEAGRACKQADGSSALQQVTLRVRHDDGSDQMTVSAAEGDLQSEQAGGAIRLRGDVRITSPDGISVEGPAMAVDLGAKTAESEGDVAFSQGDLSGRAGKLVHDWGRQRTVLTVDPEVRLVGERTRGREVTLRGTTIEYEQATRTVRASGGSLLEFEDGAIAGDLVDVVLAEATDQVARIVATGEAETRVLAGAQAGLSGPAMRRTLRAATIRHEFTGDNRLDAVQADGAASLVGVAVAEADDTRETLTGDAVALDFRGAGALTLESVEARGGPARFERTALASRREVTGSDLKLSSGAASLDHLVVTGAASIRDDGPGGRRVITGDHADLVLGGDGRRLERLEFSGKPGRLEETSEGPSGPARRVVVAREGEMRFDESGAVLAGLLRGDVDMVDGATRARADQARLEDSPRRTVLTGRASVESGGRTAHGDEVVRDDRTGVITVRGNQHTVVRDATLIPGMEANEDDPILISADSLILDERARRATYEGGRPSLHRGDAELSADRLVLDDVAGTLDARGEVESRLRLAPAGSSPPTSGAVFDPTRLVDGRSRALKYVRAERLVTYDGVASLTQENTVLRADRVDIRLKEPGQEVDTLTATGDATFVSPVRGEAEGRRIEYRSSDDRILIEGSTRPARARDTKGNFASGALVEMTQETVRVVGSSASRTRGSAAPGDTPVAQAGPAP